MPTALITGASGNLGSAMVEKFLSKEFIVIGTASPRSAGKKSNTETHFEYAVDLANETDVAAFVKEIIAKHGCPDLMINTVGGFVSGSIEETSLKDVEAQFRLNFHTTYNLSRQIFLEMRKNGGGRIYLTAARTGREMKYAKGMTAYGLSKSLVFRLAELLNLEGSGENVFTAVIVPTTIDTPENRKAMPKADFSKWTKAEVIAEGVLEHFEKKSSAETLDC